MDIKNLDFDTYETCLIVFAVKLHIDELESSLDKLHHMPCFNEEESEALRGMLTAYKRIYDSFGSYKNMVEDMITEPQN